MSSIFDRFVTERHHLVVEEGDVTNVLKQVNAHCKSKTEIRVGNCGWADDPTKWFVHFTTTRAKWYELVNAMKIVRTWNHETIPKNTIGVVYSTD